MKKQRIPIAKRDGVAHDIVDAQNGYEDWLGKENHGDKSKKNWSSRREKVQLCTKICYKRHKQRQSHHNHHDEYHNLLDEVGI